MIKTLKKIKDETGALQEEIFLPPKDRCVILKIK